MRRPIAPRRNRDSPPAVALALLLASLGGCAAPVTAPSARPAAPAVVRPGLATPVHVRSCCVLGDSDVRGAADLGAHAYDSGAVVLAGEARGRDADERNGLVYTCRGGFIDVARVRDSADTTAFLAPEIESRLDSGGAIALADEGGTVYVLVHAADPSQTEARGKRALAVDAAGWVAFQIGVWREIVEWYGGGWSGRAGAFSPEDAYSALFGIGLAKQILDGDAGILTAGRFERAMSERLPVALASLGAVSADSARSAALAVDGHWWDSKRPVSDASRITRRRFDVWGEQQPWLVCDAFRKSRCPYRDCGAQPDRLALDNPTASGAVELAAVATLEIEVDAALGARGFPFPRDDSDTVTQDDFPAIVESIRRSLHREGTK